MRQLSVASLALAALLVTACATGGASPAASPDPASPGSSGGAGSGGPATGADLDGRTFIAQGSDGYVIVPGSTISLAFDGIRVGANAGCNSMSAEYEIVDGVMQAGMFATTDMACEPPLMAQDTWLAAFLPGAAATLDGDTLTLAKGDVTLTLLDKETANPDRPLAGTTWVVDGIIDRDSVSSVPTGAVATLVFGDGTVDVQTGCNGGSGSAVVGDGVIAFTVGVTERACAPDVMALEQAVLGTLGSDTTYAIDADVLTLRNGAAGLTLRAAP